MFVGKLKRRIVKSVLGLLAIICVVSVMAMSVTVSAEENLLAFPGRRRRRKVYHRSQRRQQYFSIPCYKFE